MNVEIVTPSKKIYEGNADGVQVPGFDGSFEILNAHAPILATLANGKVRIREGKENRYFDIAGGLIEVKNNKVVLLAESVKA
jgi:F-type H+-transporting ATPase subunit epsilon